MAETKKEAKKDAEKETKAKSKAASTAKSSVVKKAPAVKSSSKATTSEKSSAKPVQKASKTAKSAKAKGGSKKTKIIGIVAGVLIVLVAILVVIFCLTRPISKEDAANKFAEMLDRYNSKLVDIKNDAKVFDIDKMRTDAEEMVAKLDENIKEARETRWPEGLSEAQKRLSGDKVSDMELYARDLEKKKEYFQSLIDAEDEDILNAYKENEPYSIIDTDDFREKLGLPSKTAEKNKYHEYTDDEVTEKLQETALEVNLGKYYIDCKEDYGYVRCDSNLDATVRNKSKLNFTNGGVVDVTAYDATGNPIETESIYLGNRLEKGQTAKQKIFDYIRDEYRNDFLNNPTFKVTKIQLY